jgi:hypothetical protein
MASIRIWCAVCIWLALGSFVAAANGPAPEAATTRPAEIDPSTLQPSGDGWTPLIGKTLDGWKAEPEFWKIEADGTLHGRTPGEKVHHYCWTEKSYDNFEMHADFRLIGNNTGICIRIAPTSFDNCPGYQVDIGEGYYGCLWDERGRGMVVKYPPEAAAKIVHLNDWNHYYIRAQGHHIQAWLNGVKTFDTVDEKGLTTGPIGFQLCHGVGKVTDATFKNVVYRPLAEEAR